MDFQPFVEFLATFPQWFQMTIIFLIVFGGGCYLLIKTLILALKAGLVDVLQPKKGKNK